MLTSRFKHWPSFALLIGLLLVPSMAFAASQSLPPAQLHHIKVSKATDNSIQVEEVYQWLVSTPIKDQKIAVNIPSAATDLQVIAGSPQQTLSEDKLLRQMDQIITPLSWQTGNNQLQVKYQLPLSNGKLKLNFKTFYFTKVMYVLAPSEGLNVESTQLENLGVQTIDNSQFQIFGGGDIPSGTGLNFTIKLGSANSQGVVSKSSPVGTVGFHSQNHLSRWYASPLSNINPHLWIGFLVLIILGLLVALSQYLKIKARRIQGEQEQEKRDKLHANLFLRKKKLLQELINIDSTLEANLDDEITLEKRTVVLNMLKKVKWQLKSLEEDGGQW